MNLADKSVGDNTFPNLMAALSGYDQSTIKEHCRKSIHLCQIIWKRLRKFKKPFIMRHEYKFPLLIFGVTGFVILVMYYWIRSPAVSPELHYIRHTSLEVRPTTSAEEFYIIGTPMRHVPLNEIYKDRSQQEDDFSDETKPVFTVDTPGCQIPFAMIDFKKYLKADKKTKRLNCDKRAVFLKKIDGNSVQASINTGIYKLPEIKYHRCQNNFRD
ncbi:uncharacterized protein isoform X4 [Choristoneura fumiferana]|uniref:uncharacterized protein isoform X4 n=1 Tax=Choristoneura fumiferana TaxID=7141 RepID=UPI003D15C511